MDSATRAGTFATHSPPNRYNACKNKIISQPAT